MNLKSIAVKMNFTENEISVPWGHIAVREYGDKNNEAVFVVHGILDNLGAFTRLIQLLPTDFYYICVDLPGHGRSSHLPEHAVYDTLNNLLVYKRLVDYYKRDKYAIIGHSYGGQLGMIFAQIYPEFISKLVIIDSLYLFPTSPESLKSKLRLFHSMYFSTEEKLSRNSPPEYEYEEIIDKLMNFRRYGVINREGAECILERMMIPTGNGKLLITTDQRLKLFQNPVFDFDYIIKFLKASPLRCPLLMIGAEDSQAIHVYFKKLIAVFKQMKHVKMVAVEGNHDVHCSHPERIAPLITEFLITRKNKL